MMLCEVMNGARSVGEKCPVALSPQGDECTLFVGTSGQDCYRISRYVARRVLGRSSLATSLGRRARCMRRRRKVLVVKWCLPQTFVITADDAQKHVKPEVPRQEWGSRGIAALVATTVGWKCVNVQRSYSMKDAVVLAP